MGIVLFWFGLSIIVGIGANRRDRSGAGWFFLALLISPVLAGLLMLALGPANPAGQHRTEQPVEAEPRSKSFGPILEKKCPDCAEMVKADARICRFCRHQF